MEPEISRTYESTRGPKEAVMIVWVTLHEARADRLVLVVSQREQTAITMPQWDGWCERTGARLVETDADRARWAMERELDLEAEIRESEEPD